MGSNGLVANPSKTEFMLLNNKDKENIRTIRVGRVEIQETDKAKLLGIIMDNDQNWTTHFLGKERFTPSFKSETLSFQKNSKPHTKDKLKQVVSSN